MSSQTNPPTRRKFVHRTMSVNNELKHVSYIGLTQISVYENNKIVRYPITACHPADVAIALGTTQPASL